MKAIKKIICFILISFHFCALCKSEEFLQLKSEINHLESSIIQDFSLDLEKKIEDMDIHEHAKLGQKIKAKYAIQKNLFATIHNALTELKHRVNHLLSKNKITSKESENLHNAIEYSQRIILRSRKQEINSLYTRFVSKLKYKPNLEEIYSQIELINSPTCPIANLNKTQDKIIFNVKQKNKFGNWLTSPYTVRSNDLESGKLSMSVAHNSNALPFHQFVTYYNHKNDRTQSSFTITQNAHGDIDVARFHLEKKIPLLTFLGFEFGEQTVTQDFECPAKKKHKNSFRATASQ